MAPFQTLTAQLRESKPLNGYTRHLEFEVQPAQRFGFVPGQWVSLRQSKPDGEEFTRAYSIASPPDGSRFALCLNRVQDGFMSNYLCDMPEGAEISFQGPFGDFILRPPMRDTIMIATGTGIAPFRSMLQWLFASDSDKAEDAGPRPSFPRHENRELWLVFGVRYEHDLYYDAEFKKLSEEHSNFHYVPTLSRGESSWTGARGYVQDHVKEIVGDRTDIHAYICGLDCMVSANRELLKSLGWDRKSIRYEKYD